MTQVQPIVSNAKQNIEDMQKTINKPLWALGLMSGTSADGIDAALLQTDGVIISAFGPTYFVPYPTQLRDQILNAYGRPPGPEEGTLSRDITEQHAEVVRALFKKARLYTFEVELIGFHGQTLFHNPPCKKGEKGQTYQIGDGHLLATLTGVPVVDQFRIHDVAQGGQGAPLVPIFHQSLAKDLPKPLCIVNIGGVANITWIGAKDHDLIAFDIGPGNGLIDDWVRQHSRLPWDEGGKIAAKGYVNTDLLTQWLAHPYFTQEPPKSLDRQTFQKCLEDVKTLCFEDGVATLTAFTAAALANALKYVPEPPVLCLVVGGGTYNLTLLQMIMEKLTCPVHLASDFGWNVSALEAQAFAFLAVRALRHLPLTFPRTTGVPSPLSGGRVCNISSARKR